MSKILIVEDEVAIADLEKDYLELSGFEVEVENDGTNGLARALAEDFDLFILDLMLPGIDGFEICKQIRGKKNTPILMVSAKKDDIDKIRGLGLGADDYVTKPFNPLELVARVKSQLRRYSKLGSMPETGKNVLVNGGLVLEDDKKQVTLDGEPVKLTPTEYKIVRLFMQNIGIVFSSAQIYESIWEGDSYATENIVSVHIRRIREKIEINPKEPKHIKVMWGVGYKMDHLD